MHYQISRQQRFFESIDNFQNKMALDIQVSNITIGLLGNLDKRSSLCVTLCTLLERM